MAASASCLYDAENKEDERSALKENIGLTVVALMVVCCDAIANAGCDQVISIWEPGFWVAFWEGFFSEGGVSCVILRSGWLDGEMG